MEGPWLAFSTGKLTNFPEAKPCVSRCDTDAAVFFCLRWRLFEVNEVHLAIGKKVNFSANI